MHHQSAMQYSVVATPVCRQICEATSLSQDISANPKGDQFRILLYIDTLRTLYGGVCLVHTV